MNEDNLIAGIERALSSPTCSEAPLRINAKAEKIVLDLYGRGDESPADVDDDGAGPSRDGRRGNHAAEGVLSGQGGRVWRSPQLDDHSRSQDARSVRDAGRRGDQG